MWGELLYYLFALGYHVFGCLIFGGVIGEIADPNGNWDASKGCYRGFGMQFTDVNGDWYQYSDTATAMATPPACNNEATAELIMIAVASAFVAADTIFTIISWMLCACDVFAWPAGDSFMDTFSSKMLFKTWDEENSKTKGKVNSMAQMFYKMLRMMSIFGSYLTAFIWACGFTASFNSRPQGPGVTADHVTMHVDNFAFANSGFFVAAMISILVTILPRNQDAGYATL